MRRRIPLPGRQLPSLSALFYYDFPASNTCTPNAGLRQPAQLQWRPDQPTPLSVEARRASTQRTGRKKTRNMNEKPLQRHVFIVFSNPVTGQENEFDSWYREVHVPDLLTLAGFIRAQRFCLSATQITGTHPHRHAVIYEIETRDLHATFGELKKKLKDGSFVTSTAIDHTTLVAHVYTALG